MAFTLREVAYWLQDVREYWRISRQRKSLQKPGQGYDYKDDYYLGLVQRVVSELHPKRMKLQATEILEETSSTKTFRCKRLDGPMPFFRAGQYLSLFVDVDGVLTSRPYSISSAPGSDSLDLTVQEKSGGFVSTYLLHELKAGDEIETTGPEGHFSYEPLIDGEDLVFLAGGSGITPFMSILRDMLQNEQGVKIHLLYGSRRASEVIFGEELTHLAGEYANFSYSLVISEPAADYGGLTGFLDERLIRSQIGEVEGKTFYICGPNVMIDFCLKSLSELGVPAYKIRCELYGPPEDVTRESGWPLGLSREALFNVEIKGNKRIRALAGEPLMVSLERHEVTVPAVCRSGACSACRIRLLAGRVFMPDRTALRESDRRFGYIYACMAYPIEDLEIQL
jgi:ferredoxin-NADP reductase